MLGKSPEFSEASGLFHAGLGHSSGILHGLVKVSKCSLVVGVPSAWHNPANCFQVADVTILGWLRHVVFKSYENSNGTVAISNQLLVEHQVHAPCMKWAWI